MANLRWGELFKVLFLAGFVGYLAVALTGRILVGIPTLLVFAWLCYDFRSKVRAFRQIAWREMGKEARDMLGELRGSLISFWTATRETLWDENQSKICSVLLTAAVVAFVIWMPFGFEWKDGLVVAVMAISAALGFLFVTMLAVLSSITNKDFFPLSDKKITLFFGWRLPKLFIKAIILTVGAVHSRELAATALYSLSGMIYVILFPPFALAPAQIFLLAIGCGLFTGVAGMAIHKVLLTAVAQDFFTKVAAW